MMFWICALFFQSLPGKPISLICKFPAEFCHRTKERLSGFSTSSEMDRWLGAGMQISNNCNRVSISALGLQSGNDRMQEYMQVQPDGPILNIIYIKIDTFFI